MTETPSSTPSPRHLGNSYVLEEQIGSGAQGEVWKGRAKDSPQPLAFKILHTAITTESSVIDAFLKERTVMDYADGEAFETSSDPRDLCPRTKSPG